MDACGNDGVYLPTGDPIAPLPPYLKTIDM